MTSPWPEISDKEYERMFPILDKWIGEHEHEWEAKKLESQTRQQARQLRLDLMCQHVLVKFGQKVEIGDSNDRPIPSV